MTTSIIVSGARGKMGSKILSLAFQDSLFKVVGAIEREGHSELGNDIGELLGLGRKGVALSSDAGKALQEADVHIEFSAPQATLAHLKEAIRFRKAVVIGTTGFSPRELQEVMNAGSAIPVLWTPNMSVGVNLLFEMVAEAARKLGPDYEVEIVEAHHHSKKDSPSGTAKFLAEKIAAAKKVKLDSAVVYGRKGLEETRPKDQIGIHSLRMGDVVGDHTIIFATEGERLEFTHRASSRDTFAIGALRAARFLAGKAPKFYTMQDVLSEP